MTLLTRQGDANSSDSLLRWSTTVVPGASRSASSMSNSSSPVDSQRVAEGSPLFGR